LGWLRQSRSARVLHRFEGVCNLVNERGEVLSLVAPSVGPGPFAVVLAAEWGVGMSADDAVSIDHQRSSVTVGDLTIDVARAAIWQPRPDWSRLRRCDDAGWPAAELPPDLDDALRGALAAIAADDRDACHAAVDYLAGRGEGLTPAGDDALVGLLYGLWVWRPRREWLERIVERAAPRTTTLSANFLLAAAAGEAVRQWHELIDGRPGAAEGIIATGHTSGADTWAGFIRTRAMFKEDLSADCR